jgi:DNA-binding HxlR family transcriptional regulator
MDSGRDFGDSFGYDAFKRTCMSHTVLEVLASKWVYLVVCALRTATLRHGELARKIEGITPKMLTQTLRELERDGLVTRKIYPVIPPKVEYELTDLGRNLAALLDQIRAWSEQNAPHIREARARAQMSAGEMAEFQS